MKLILFDIDDTLIDSVSVDDFCFKETFKKLYNIDLSEANWNDFKHVTDTGLTIEIFNKWLSRMPSQKEILDIKSEFYRLLNTKTNAFTEIEGAIKFINSISKNTDFEIAFATGGWKETALLKCKSIGLDLSQHILKSSNDHFDRGAIIELAIEAALEKHNFKKFKSIIYFGDGLWDLKTTSKLGIDFIGVDSKNNNILSKAGCNKITNSYNNLDKILNWIKN